MTGVQTCALPISRNTELHSSDAVLSNLRSEHLLPRWLRVVEVLCRHLGEDLNAFVSDDLINQARALVDQADKKLENEIAMRIHQAKLVLEALTEPEIAARKLNAFLLVPGTKAVQCPACGCDAEIGLGSPRFTHERIEEDEIHWEKISIADGLECRVCGLALHSSAEVFAAGLHLEHSEAISESISERYVNVFADDDYGND